MPIQKLATRDQLIEYCYRQLGAPVINIEIDKTQAEDRVNDALNLFYEYHFDGSERDYLTLTLTQDNVDTGSIELPDGIFTVVSVAFMDSMSTMFSSNNLQYQMYFSDIISSSYSYSAYGDYGLTTYVNTMSYLNTMNAFFSSADRITSFTKHNMKLKINTNWSKYKAGDKIGIEVFKTIDADVYPDVYDNYWLKKYSAALIMKQWGINLMKFGNIPLPGGGITNAQDILQQANTDIEKLEEQLKNEFTMNPLPFMG